MEALLDDEIINKLPWPVVNSLCQISIPIRAYCTQYWSRRGQNLLGYTTPNAQAYSERYNQCYPGALDQPPLDDCLLLASERDDVETVFRLLDQGADPNLATIIAASRGYTGLVRQLLARNPSSLLAAYLGALIGLQSNQLEEYSNLLDEQPLPPSSLDMAYIILSYQPESFPLLLADKLFQQYVTQDDLIELGQDFARSNDIVLLRELFAFARTHAVGFPDWRQDNIAGIPLLLINAVIEVVPDEAEAVQQYLNELGEQIVD